MDMYPALATSQTLSTVSLGSKSLSSSASKMSFKKRSPEQVKSLLKKIASQADENTPI